MVTLDCRKNYRNLAKILINRKIGGINYDRRIFKLRIVFAE